MLNKANILAVILFISIGIAFTIVSALLIIKPDNTKFIKQKLKFGAAIIVITAFFNGCAPKGSDVSTCYVEVPPPSDSKNDTITVRKTGKDTVYQKFLKQAVKTTKKKVKKGEEILIIEDSIVVSCYEVQIEIQDTGYTNGD